MIHCNQLFKCSIFTGTVVVVILGFAALGRGDVNITNAVQMVTKVAFMGKAVSNELVRISHDQGISDNIRQLASNALHNYDSSGTNTYDEIESFVNNWAMINEPAMSSNTIAVMKESLEMGISAFKQLEDYASDTNTPPYLRDIAGLMVTNLTHIPLVCDRGVRSTCLQPRGAMLQRHSINLSRRLLFGYSCCRVPLAGFSLWDIRSSCCPSFPPERKAG